jgi:phosphatidylglycerophosphate synthase
MIPAIVIAELASFKVSVLSIFCFMLITDLFDGTIARTFYVKKFWGPVFDIAADFSVIMAIALLLYTTGVFGLLSPLCVFVSCIAYALSVNVKKSISFGKIGKYAGAVCYGSFAFFFSLRIIFAGQAQGISFIAGIVISAFLMISIIESLVFSLLIKR